MKLIDKFLKKLGTDRNTFATYILTLISIYIVVDRVVEILFMIFTGVSHTYWGPITYTFALACPLFAFAFSCKSKFAPSYPKKVTLFYVYIILFYIIALSMFTQWLNMGAWLLLLSVPNYTELVTDFSELITPAFVSISIYLPLATIYPMFRWLYFGVADSKDQTRSIWDYAGISLAPKSSDTGPYSCETYVCTDNETGKSIIFPEASRYQSLFVCGGSGSGKTSLVYEPLIARDLEKKFFFKEASKELGFAALKTGLAYITAPYDNDYMNANFSLNMLAPSEGRESIYKTFVKKLILSSNDSEIYYKNLGLTLMSPDYEVIKHMTEVAKNFGFNYHIIDPSNSNSIGLNPFVYDNPSKIAIAISSALKAMYSSTHKDGDDLYRDDLIVQAIENLAIILKVMYPKMNEGNLPNMDDLLKMFTNFDLIEKMCEIMAHDEELREEYSVQLTYCKKYFYKNGPGKDYIEKFLYSPISQLDNLLRMPGVKSILCNRHNNLDFDKALENGDLIFICTRRGDLGASANKAFGLFFLISFQNAVLRRPGNEKSRIPNFLYIDEFADFLCKETEPMFTMFRKYKVATTVSCQSLAQLEPADQTGNFKGVILSNCANKIFTGNADVNELKWWSDEFGSKREWVYSNSMDMEKMEYSKNYGNVKWDFVAYFKPGKLQTLGAKNCAYKIRGENGKPMCGPGNLDYMSSKYKEKQKEKYFDFGKYSDSVTTATEDDSSSNAKKKFDFKNIDFTDERNEVDPVQTDTTDSKYLFKNNDAVIVNLNRRKKKN